jgi:hypothetical protein
MLGLSSCTALRRCRLPRISKHSLPKPRSRSAVWLSTSPSPLFPLSTPWLGCSRFPLPPIKSPGCLRIFLLRVVELMYDTERAGVAVLI